MKQSFLLGLVLLSPSLLLAQEIPNGDFELWSIQVLFERPDDWDNGNYQDAPVVTTTKVTGAPEGQFAAHLETQILDDDTAFGYVLLGRIDETPVAGVPHGTDVAAVECWLRYDLQPGDTALALAVCWSGGTIVSSGEWRYQGQQTTWMQQTFTLPLAATNVDSVVVAFASTDPFTEGIAQQGSWVEVDDVHLTHPNVPTPDALPNAGFEDWSDVSAEDPDGWASYNARVAGFGFNSVSKSTDANSGAFSAMLATIGAFGDTLPAVLTNGLLNDQGPYAGIPYVATPMQFTGAYKYQPSGMDEAFVGVTFLSGGVPIGNAVQQIPAAAATWTPFSVNVNIFGGPPDSILVAAFSGDNPGSTLWVDDLDLSGGDVGLDEREGMSMQPWPNPTRDRITIPGLQAEDRVRVRDASGRVVREWRMSMAGPAVLDLGGLVPGAYLMEVRSGNEVATHRLVKLAD